MIRGDKRERAALVAIVRRNVSLLGRDGRKSTSRGRAAHQKLHGVMELTGYVANWTEQTSRSLADAIVGLATVIPMKDLRETARGAVFYRTMPLVGRKKGDSVRAGIAADKAVARARRAAATRSGS